MPFCGLPSVKIPYTWCITQIDVRPEVWSIQVPIFSCGIGRVARIFWKYQDQDPTTHPKINTEGALKKGTVFSKCSKQQFFWSKQNVNVQGSNKQKWGVESSGLGNQTRTDELQVVGLPKNEVNKNGNCKYRHHSLCDLFFNFHDSQLHCVWAGYNVSLFIVFEVKAQYIQYVAFCFLFIYLLCFNKQFEGTSIGSLLVKGNPKK